MSKFKVGDRVITLRCKRENTDIARFPIGTVGIVNQIYNDNEFFGKHNIGVYNKSFHTSYFYAEDELELVTDDEIYRTGFEDGMKKAWDVAKQLYNCDGDKLYDCFGYYAIERIINSMSPDEVLAKIEEYEKNRICVGDIVKHPINPIEYIIIDVDTGDAISTDFKSCDCLNLVNWEKTGRSVDISKLVDLVNKMKGDQ